jgi:cyclopropane-fatty-acyl-phospholipid synthase
VVPAAGSANFTLEIRHPGALRTAFKPPADLNTGRAFAAGLIDVHGDMESAVGEMLQAFKQSTPSMLVRIALLLHRLPAAPLPRLREANLKGKRHSVQRDRAAIGFHYDQPVAFYQSFLDREMVYSCAYFDDGISDLAQAQRAKIDYSLRKLRLRPGERLLDIGCGWGALVVRAAQQFGAHVLGVTLSEVQLEEARRRIAQANVQDRANVELWDYRELPATAFDKVVSIGMFEHVGRARMPQYFNTVFGLLRSGGLFLNHGIATEEVSSDGKAAGFMDRLIFPDGELLPISDALQVAQRSGFEIRDLENLREHYMRTLRAWVANLERNRQRAVFAAGEQAYRAWRLYLAGSAQGFRSARMALFQTLLAKRREDGSVEIPATRRDLYSQRTVRAELVTLR